MVLPLKKKTLSSQSNLDSPELEGVVRLNEEDEKREEERRKKELEIIQQRQSEMLQKTTVEAKPAIPKIKVKRKKLVQDRDSKKKKVDPPKPAPPTKKSSGGLAGLLGAYGSDSASE
jgi:hypothetical protein